jgi:hypothetical protein
MENGACREDEAPVRLLSVMTSARQDSGSLPEFKEVGAAVSALFVSVLQLTVPR